MRTAPELVVRLPLLIEQLNELLNGWDDARFIQVLPDLRFAFSQLTLSKMRKWRELWHKNCH